MSRRAVWKLAEKIFPPFEECRLVEMKAFKF